MICLQDAAVSRWGCRIQEWDVVCAVDNWQPAIEIYRLNFNHPVIDLDLLNVKGSVKQLVRLDADLVVGGPPCQDFSHAGKRDENGGRANLTISFAEIVASLKSEFFIMENVDQVTKFHAYDRAIQIFKESGYKLYRETLNASYFAVPQRRRRHFVVGHLHAREDEFYILISGKGSIKQK